MAKVKASIRIEDAPIDEIEELWNDTSRWTGFVDGFGAIDKTSGDWPDVGATVVWDSRPGGRGRVKEKVLEYTPGERQIVGVLDNEIEGTQTVTYDIDDKGDNSVRMIVEFDFARKEAGPIARVGEALFVRSAVKASLRRTLQRFARELTSERELTDG